jgi:hypothetical protein
VSTLTAVSFKLSKINTSFPLLPVFPLDPRYNRKGEKIIHGLLKGMPLSSVTHWIFKLLPVSFDRNIVTKFYDKLAEDRTLPLSSRWH